MDIRPYCHHAYAEPDKHVRKKLIDVVVVLAIILANVLFACRFVDFSIPPFEDAAMLMRYAEHFAEGHGIVWNIGEPPVDGATDFLFMIAVGLIKSTGVSLEMATRGITLFSHFLSIALIYLALRYIYRSGILPAALSALYFSIGPGLFLCAAYFGTALFVLSVCITWIFAIRIMFVSRSTLCLVAFSFMSLTTGLIRPEGVLIALLMLTAIVAMTGLKQSKMLLVYFIATFLVFGGAYFLWRWNYFGYPLPNPFYKKGGGLYFDSLKASVNNTLKLCYPFLLVLLLALRRNDLRRLALVFWIPIAGSMVMWVLLSDEMNFGSRFQYPIVPIVLLAWYPFVAHLRQDWNLPNVCDLSLGKRIAAVAVGGVVTIGLLLASVSASRGITYPRDGRYDVALILRKYREKDYTIATTEAGLLPLYSRWRAVDTWGLNDMWIAHNDGITQEYLDRIKPDMIVWHEIAASSSQPNDKWARMVKELKTYVESNDYIAAAVFGKSPQDTHSYYCSKEVGDHAEIISRIRSIEYKWFETGGKSTNYAAP